MEKATHITSTLRRRLFGGIDVLYCLNFAKRHFKNFNNGMLIWHSEMEGVLRNDGYSIEAAYDRTNEIAEVLMERDVLWRHPRNPGQGTSYNYNEFALERAMDVLRKASKDLELVTVL